MLKKLFLLVYGKIFIAESKHENDNFSAKISAAVQVSLLITLNLISSFFLIYAALKMYFPMDAISVHRQYLLSAVGVTMVVCIGGAYRAVASIPNLNDHYRSVFESEVSRGNSKLLPVARAYPILSLAYLILSILILTVVSRA